VSILFDATDKLLIGTANANWQAVLNTKGMEPENMDGNATKQNWETYKKLVAHFICHHIYSESGIYDQQVKYTQNQHTTKGLTAKKWHRLIEEYNSYLCYLFPSLDTMKWQFENTNFSNWMTKEAGSLTKAQE
jgi:hypothetical protein